MDGITITDEATMWKNRANALKADRDAALARIAELEDREINSGRMLDMMTDANVRVKKQMDVMRRRHRQEIYDIQQRAAKRETVSGAIGIVFGFLSAGVILLVYWMTRSGVL